MKKNTVLIIVILTAIAVGISISIPFILEEPAVKTIEMLYNGDNAVQYETSLY